MHDRFSYFAYGLHILADFALWPWGANAASATCDAVTGVRVELAGEGSPYEALGFRPGLTEAVLDWPGVGGFLVSQGKKISVRPAPGATLKEVALVAAGPALALLLEQRGFVVLHGSCAAIAGSATALLGASGAGKSTIAATLREANHELISDGMTVISLSGGVPHAHPGPPHLKLWPDAIQRMSESSVVTEPVARQDEKRWYNARSGVALRPMPLRKVFLLEAGEGVSSTPLGPAAALIGLVKHYFLADFAEGPSHAFILERCGGISSAISVARLCRGNTPQDLQAVVAQLVASEL